MRDSAVNHADALLTWYDAHARDMPWRISPALRKSGQVGDPYRIWLSEVMLQQTTVAAVWAYFLRFTARWPRVTDLAAAADADVMAEWAGLGYYARARNLLACARAVTTLHGGVFPRSRDALLALPGIGPYTAAAIAAIAYDACETVVDGNVERVMARLHGVQTPMPTAKPLLVTLAQGLTPRHRPGDYAQAVMDLGATICTPRNPACALCPWQVPCVARAQGDAAQLPRKLPKPDKPLRQGIVWHARRTDGALLVEVRPDRGLLGGMLAFPSAGWDGSQALSPLTADWRDAGTLRHTFTHFHLDLTVMTAEVAADAAPNRGTFRGSNQFSAADLPTLMRKAHALATKSRQGL